MRYIHKPCILFLLATIMLVSCSDEYDYRKTEKILTKQCWEIITMVDYSQNQTAEFRTVTYSFHNDNTLYKIYENNDTVFTVWELSIDAQYLTIGPNTFRITELTNRVLSLRYGEVELFFASK
ncbi:MAG TPA: hypothetical protein PLL66_06640 [Bacteroidales bacterium]|nr:hypothetical protein [Bacteroidales bacterium]